MIDELGKEIIRRTIITTGAIAVSFAALYAYTETRVYQLDTEVESLRGEGYEFGATNAIILHNFLESQRQDLDKLNKNHSDWLDQLNKDRSDWLEQQKQEYKRIKEKTELDIKNLQERLEQEKDRLRINTPAKSL
ncbi:hypothetical protein HY486_02895 [Candidatus Woesearchaeota archaeon]|nr:hypothetical protein [Candidatus Woesearchaeota archaeon]